MELKETEKRLLEAVSNRFSVSFNYDNWRSIR